ncbi:MAG TPA: hypothetical protein VKV95_22290 [Terriglobia bacterium]|nr:hypothetical protein [Terriglobia bacterium]
MDHHIAAGILALVLTLLFLAVKYFRAPRRAMSQRGWAGLGVILLAEVYLVLHTQGWLSSNEPAIFFTPIVWTGYLLLVDGMVWTLAGHSIISSTPRRFWLLVSSSVPLWLIFEAYNLRLENWAYVGLPASPWLSGLGYAWSFATIWPAIFETADLVRALGIFHRGQSRPWALSRFSRVSIGLCGLLLVTVPVLVPAHTGQYLFGAVWLGFILLLDPVLRHWKAPSFLLEFEQGETSTLWEFLLAGAVCGIFWEFWNFWAAAKWLYVFPIGQGSKIFEMPILGYLGFPAFALECRVMYEFVRCLENRILRPRAGHALETARS